MSNIERWRLMVGPDGDAWVLDPSDDLDDMADGYRVVEVVAADTLQGAVDALRHIAESADHPSPTINSAAYLRKLAADALDALGERAAP